MVALAERGSGDHQTFVDAAKVYLNKLAAENDFAVDYITGTERINEESLAQYKLFIQLNYPPYRWAPIAKAAFEDYITQGKGGWIGFHHAALLGDFDGYPMDPWFSQFLGGIRFTHYLPDFARATVKIEDPSSPLAKGLPPSFVDRQGRVVHLEPVAASECACAGDGGRIQLRAQYHDQDGRRPPRRLVEPTLQGAQRLYLHGPSRADLFDDPNFVQLFRNAIFWGAGQ